MYSLKQIIEIFIMLLILLFHTKKIKFIQVLNIKVYICCTFRAIDSINNFLLVKLNKLVRVLSIKI